MSLASAITALDGRIKDAYTALQAKGATIPETKNSYNLPTTIATVPQGGGGAGAEWKELTFIDYDGTVLRSYTKDEGLALLGLPSNPSAESHEGLTFQGWNYTLVDIKKNLNSSGACTVGATYIPTDGKTHLFLSIDDPYYLNVTIYYNQSVADGVTIDWGDGSSTEHSSTSGETSLTHSYHTGSFPAKYDVTMTVTSGELRFLKQIFTGDNNSQSATNPVWGYRSILDEVWFGNGVKEISSDNATAGAGASFSMCRNLKHVSIPRNSITAIRPYALYGCFGLTGLVVPDGVTSIGTYAFYGFYQLSALSLPASVTSIGSYVVTSSYSLENIVVPDGVTEIPPYSFYSSYSLKNIYLPQSLTSIGNNALYYIQRIDSITLPDGITSIGQSALSNNTQLQRITMPAGITDIAATAFNTSYACITYDFSTARQIPTLANTNAFANTSDYKRIVVPNDLYESWKIATNWSTYAANIFMAEPYLIFRATVDNSTIQLNKVGNPDAVQLEYMSNNDGVWHTYTIGDVLTMASAGDTIFMRNPTTTFQKFGTDASNYHQFAMTGGVAAKGDISFLSHKDGTKSASSKGYCYYKLFSGCAALVEAPAMVTNPIANSPSYYAYTFEGCGITSVPPKFKNMDTTIYSVDVFKGMFKDCVGLTEVRFPFREMRENSSYSSIGCFSEMFKGCSNLNKIEMFGYVGDFSTDYFDDWVDGVAATGDFYYNGSDTTVGDYAIPTGWNLERIVYDGFTVVAREAGSTVSMTAALYPTPVAELQYTTNEGFTWGTFTPGTTTVTLANVGDRVGFRGNNTTLGDGYGYNKFAFTGQVALAGNINSLLTKEGYNELTDLSDRTHVFRGLFYGQTAIVDAENLVLPATDIGNMSYLDTFSGCSNLVTPPKELPADNLTGSVYHSMFYGCSSMTKAPYLRFTSLKSGSTNQLYQMFQGCSALQEIKMDYTGNIDFYNWVNGVPSGGIMYYNGPTISTGYSSIPTGWLVCPFNQPFSFIFVNKTEVNLGYTPTISTRYVGKFRGTGDIVTAIGGRETGTVYLRTASGLNWTLDTHTLNSGNNTWDASKWYDIDAGNFYVNATPDSGTQISLSGTTDPSWYSKPDGCKLGRETYGGSICLANLKIYEGQTLMKNFEPAVDNNDVACLHETVGNTYLYPSSGTMMAFMVDRQPYDGFAVEPTGEYTDVTVVKDLGAPDLNLEYSMDEGLMWNTYTVGTAIRVNAGQRACFRGNNTKWGGSNASDRNRFTFSAPAKVSGNINSLLTATGYNQLLDISSRARVFQHLFYMDTNIVDAEDLVLPATSIGNYAYYWMFYGCSWLTKAPKVLPATSISDYNSYHSMFRGCSRLTKAPYIKATSFANSTCVNMFYGCSALNEMKLDYLGDFGTTVFTDWVKNVGGSGTFYYNGLYATRGDNSIPANWTITQFQ